LKKNEVRQKLPTTLLRSLEQSHPLTPAWLCVKLRYASSSPAFTTFVYSQISHRRGDHEDL
jgi:hypothetical protein